MGSNRLHQLWAYARQVFHLVTVLDQIRDTRQDPEVATALVVRILFVVGLLRLRSFNALDPRLGEAQMGWLLDAKLRRCGKLCSVDTLGYTLAKTEIGSARKAVVHVNRKAERNKVFREGSYGALRFCALDGWEPICGKARHCDHCLTRKVKVKSKDGTKTVTEYYHAMVVALLLNDRLELVLDAEPIRSADRRREAGEAEVPGHEGELTAAKRLVRRLRTTYGGIVDVLVGDALYPGGPFWTLADECGFGTITVLKKETDEPLKEALRLWKKRPPDQVVEDKARHERIQIWDCPELTTLDTYKRPVRVVRAVVEKLASKSAKPTTWCFAVTGKAKRLPAISVVRAGRDRWHLENTGFNQWTQHWHFTHVFTHSPNGIEALWWIFFLAFNLMQLFVYRQLKSYGRDRGRDVTRTIVRLVDEMRDDLARLNERLAWDSS